MPQGQQEKVRQSPHLGTPLRALFGLGNPGPRYALQRHNYGHWLVDLLAEHHTLKEDTRLKTAYTTIDVGGHPLTIAKPLTYMNDSGEAVQRLAAYFNHTPDSIMIAYDELDLARDQIKLKFGGGAAGHNGIKSVVQHLGTRDFWRLRLGIGRPTSAQPPHSWVLSVAPTEDRQSALAAMQDAFPALPFMMRGEWNDAFQHLHNPRMDPTAL